jgi:hypothetical protein
MADAFADLNEGTSTELAATLQAKLNTGDPMRIGETYKLHVTFF